jgi:hypothetical protein
VKQRLLIDRMGKAEDVATTVVFALRGSRLHYGPRPAGGWRAGAVRMPGKRHRARVLALQALFEADTVAIRRTRRSSEHVESAEADPEARKFALSWCGVLETPNR